MPRPAFAEIVNTSKQIDDTEFVVRYHPGMGNGGYMEKNVDTLEAAYAFAEGINSDLAVLILKVETIATISATR